MGHAQLERHVVLNGVGWLLPALLAIAAVPALATLLQPDRFGLLSLTWAAVSTFAILDLGLGRALSLAVADRRARGRAAEVPALVRAAGVLTWAACVPCALTGLIVAPWIAEHLLDLPPALLAEGTRSVRWLAIALPLVVHGIVLRAALEGALRFEAVNAFRVPLGIVTWGGPWLAAAYSTDVSVLTGVVVGGRAVYWAAQWWLLAREARGVQSQAGFAPYRALWVGGSWITLSGLLTPVMTALDRMLVPMVAPIAAVGWYVAAGEGATKLWLFPAALAPVLGPALAAAFARGEAVETTRLLVRATRATRRVLVLPALLLAGGADPLLQWWLRESFDPAVVAGFQWFVVAVFANSIAQVSYAGLQAGGQARAAAQLHLVELPLFAGALWWAAQRYGASGAAAVWGARLLLDAVAMMALGTRRVGLPAGEAMRSVSAIALLLIPLLWRWMSG